MAYGPEEASRDLTLVGEESASFEVRARLEHHLLSLLREQGCAGVAAFLQSLPEHHFISCGAADPETEARFVSYGPGNTHIEVTTFKGPHSFSVNVTAEDESIVPQEPDPRHLAFYKIWEGLLGMPDSAAAKLDTKRRAVFLVGLLEAEVMNGGLGQYLVNTDGAYLNDTIEYLTRIGAVKTCSILTEAGKLGAQAGSFIAAWETYAREFEKLDERFMESGEDLAALTAAVFIDHSTGEG